MINTKPPKTDEVQRKQQEDGRAGCILTVVFIILCIFFAIWRFN